MIESIWPFLKDHDNLAILGSIGAVIAAIAAGAWAIFTHFDKKSEKAPSAPNVSANHGSVAAGRDITGPVTINPDAGEVVQQVAAAQNDRYDKILAEIARNKGVEIAPLLAVLVKLGEKGVSEEDIPKRLNAAADELIKLRAENEQFRRGPPALAAIAEEVQALLDKGEFDDARRALARGREAARAQRIDTSRYEAAFLAQEARVDDLQLAYRAAAAKYAEAATLVAPFDTEQQWRFLLGQADELFKQGDEFGDNAALIEAINALGRCLALAPRSERPLEWAMLQNSLGNALVRLGERESETARLEEAVAAYHVALEERTRARVPLDWAMTQMNLGTAFATLGEREKGTEKGAAKLKQAVAAYNEALLERTRERWPLDWAATQMNLGNALKALGEWEEGESGKAQLKAAVVAFQEALKERTRKRVPLLWAGTQMNLGDALRILGEREGGTALLDEAVVAFHEALKEWTRARVPPQWAMTQHNLALVQLVLFRASCEPRHLDDALEAVIGAIEEFREAKADFYIEKAERLRGQILAAKGN